MDKYIVFRCRQEEYAITIDQVIAIERAEGFTSVPQLPHYVKGMIRSRGHLVPVLDIEMIFYNRAIEESKDRRIIIIQGEEFEYGLLVAETKEIIDIAEGLIEKPGLLLHIRLDYLKGIANFKNRLISIIDSHRFVSSLDGNVSIVEYITEAKEAEAAL
ncbi:chemotaxis protein CheW [Cytobacillus kochii]